MNKTNTNLYSQPRFYRVMIITIIAGLIEMSVSLFFFNLNGSVSLRYGLVGMIGTATFISLYHWKWYKKVINDIIDTMIALFTILGFIYFLEGIFLPVGFSQPIKNGFISTFPWIAIVVWMFFSILISARIESKTRLNEAIMQAKKYFEQSKNIA